MSRTTEMPEKIAGLGGPNCARSGGGLASSDGRSDGLQRWHLAARPGCTVRRGSMTGQQKQRALVAVLANLAAVIMKHHHRYMLDVFEDMLGPWDKLN